MSNETVSGAVAQASLSVTFVLLAHSYFLLSVYLYYLHGMFRVKCWLSIDPFFVWFLSLGVSDCIGLFLFALLSIQLQLIPDSFRTWVPFAFVIYAATLGVILVLA